MRRHHFFSLLLPLVLLSFIKSGQCRGVGGRGGRGGFGSGGVRSGSGRSVLAGLFGSRRPTYSSGVSYVRGRGRSRSSTSYSTRTRSPPEKLLSPTGEDRWVRGNSSLATIISHARLVEEKTRYGTVLGGSSSYTSASELHRQLVEKKVVKRVGLGVPATFLAGPDYVSQKAFISVYHRYRKYLELRDTWDLAQGLGDEGDSLSLYYIDNYHRNRCSLGCPANTTCEWGICQCEDPAMVQIWGECVSPDVMERNETLLELEIEGKACSSHSFCQEMDINALCFRAERRQGAGWYYEEGEEGVCQCRHEMQWNKAAFECQVYIDADCKTSYSASTIFRNILKAEDAYRRGYKDAMEKHEIILNMTNIDSFTLSFLGTVPGKLCEFVGNGFGRDGGELMRKACRVNSNNPAAYLIKRKSLPSKYTLPIPTNRTQNPEEALQGSLLLFYTMNKTDFHPITPPDIIPSMPGERYEGEWKSHLKEAFCRSVEPFSEVFDTRPKQGVETGQLVVGMVWKRAEGNETWEQRPVKEEYDIDRPATCWRLPSSNCAQLFDSHTCSSKAWRLDIRDGEQRSFAYFSSDWKYRNDADLVAVRHGCSFTGFTGVNFSGKSVQIAAGRRDRWVDFAKFNSYSPFHDLHESILSYQCVCRAENVMS